MKIYGEECAGPSRLSEFIPFVFSTDFCLSAPAEALLTDLADDAYKRWSTNYDQRPLRLLDAHADRAWDCKGGQRVCQGKVREAARSSTRCRARDDDRRDGFSSVYEPLAVSLD